MRDSHTHAGQGKKGTCNGRGGRDLIQHMSDKDLECGEPLSMHCSISTVISKEFLDVKHGGDRLILGVIGDVQRGQSL